MELTGTWEILCVTYWRSQRFRGGERPGLQEGIRSVEANEGAAIGTWK
ncbi:MAG: hypothetical protein KBC28_11195 [Alphaproteobacteria bacterium]|nr:hypothetical protein [Alphaproteobacteria bacterium]